MVHMIGASGNHMWVSDRRTKEYEAAGAKLAVSSTPASEPVVDEKPKKQPAKKAKTTKKK